MPHKVQYQRLSQTDTEEEGKEEEEEDEGFEENILFDYRLANPPLMDREELFELEKLGHTKFAVPKFLKSCKLRLFLLVSILAFLCVVVALALLLSYGFKQVPEPSGDGWSLSFNSTYTIETSLHLQDVDGDGKTDVIVVTLPSSHAQEHDEYEDAHNLEIQALRVIDGMILWSLGVSDVTCFCCLDVDLSADGNTDCLVSGSGFALKAVDSAHGHVLWTTSYEDLSFDYGSSIQGIEALPDIDNDGTPDIILVSHDHYTSHMILISGKTGLRIGKGFLKISDLLKIPTVKYVTTSKAIYILFGADKGKLQAISLPDLYFQCTGNRLTTPEGYNWLSGRQDHNGVSLLYRFPENIHTLVVTNPLKGKKNLVLSSGSNVTLLDAESLQLRWTHAFDGALLAGSPTPVYFDKDSHLDFWMQLNLESGGAQTVLLSGLDGSTLWMGKRSNYTLSSRVSVADLANLRGYILSPVVGRGIEDNRTLFNPESADSDPSSQVEFPLPLSHDAFQTKCKEVQAAIQIVYPSCDDGFTPWNLEILLLHNNVTQHPRRLAMVEPERKNYSISHVQGSQHCNPLSGELPDIEMCTVLLPTRYTGVLGDVDSDGELDLIQVTQLAGFKRDDYGHIIGKFTTVEVSKRSVVEEEKSNLQAFN